MSCKNCIFYLVVLLLLFNVSACTKSNAAEKGQIFGRITLDGISDHSGIAVSVYPAGLVPEAVVGIREQYPQLAFPITDREAFDHRQHEALQMVYTDQTGSFSFSKLPYNKYIVAYCKEGWGYNYLLDLELNSGELDLSVINSILCPEQELPSYIDGQYTLEDGKCYVVKNDLVLGESAQFVFQEGSRLLIDRNVRISSYGAITFPDDGRAYVTSYSGVYSGNIDEANLGNGLYLYSGSNELKNLSFSHLRNALQVTVNGFTIENLSFKDCTFGFVSRAMTNLAVKNCYFQDNESTDTAACYGYDIQGYLAEYNIFSGNYIAVKNEIVKEATVSNNAFVDNTLSFFNSYESTAEFINNNLNSTGIGVENTGKSNLSVSHNDLNCRICVKTSVTGNWGNTQQQGWTKANNNNFNAVEHAVLCRAVYYYQGNSMPLDFAQNYWGTTLLGEIEDLILDFNDLPPYDATSGGNYGIVEFIPYRTSRVSTAGIQ